MAETTPVATAANWLDAPYNRWGFRHVPDLLPTAVIGRGSGPVRELPRAERDLDGFSFTHEGRRLDLDEMLDLSGRARLGPLRPPPRGHGSPLRVASYFPMKVREAVSFCVPAVTVTVSFRSLPSLLSGTFMSRHSHVSRPGLSGRT